MSIDDKTLDWDSKNMTFKSVSFIRFEIRQALIDDLGIRASRYITALSEADTHSKLKTDLYNLREILNQKGYREVSTKIGAIWAKYSNME